MNERIEPKFTRLTSFPRRLQGTNFILARGSGGAARKSKVFLTAVLVLVLALHASAHHVFAQDDFYQQVTRLINAKEYAGAYQEAQRLLEQRPDDIYLLRVKGVCLMEAGYQDQAVAVLRKAVALDPDSVSSRYFLGQALAYRGSIREAVAILETVVSLAPESAYARNTQTILPQLLQLIETEQVIADEQRWNAYFRAAFEYDDNVPLRASNSPFDSPTDSWRLSYSFYGEARFPDQKIDKMPFTLGLGYSLSGSEYERSEFDIYDLFSNDVSLFVSRDGTLFDNFYSVRLNLHATDTKLGWDPYSKIAGTGLSFQYNWLGMVASTLSASMDSKDYEEDTEFPEYYSLDGKEYNFGFFNSIYLLDNRLVLGLNYNYRKMDAEGIQAELRSNDLSGSITVSLPLRLRLYAYLGYQQEDYPDYYPVARLDDVWTVYTSLQRPIWQEKLFLELGYTYSTANSDYEYAEYRRNIFSAGLNLSF